MTTSIITAVTHSHEQSLVKGIDAASGLTLIRRCADVAELVSTGSSGVADIAVVSPSFRGLDRDALRHLAGHGVRVAGLVSVGDDPGESKLRQLGVSTILRPTATVEELQAALTQLAEGTTSAPSSPAESITDDDLAALLRSEPASGLPGESAGAVPEAPPSWTEPVSVGAPSPVVVSTGAPVEGPGRGGVTTVWGPTGAPGRTTVAVTLASEFASRGLRTLLIDLDTWGASVAQALALIDEAPGVAAAARAAEQGTLDRESLSRVSPEVGPGLRVLTGLPKPERWPELRAAAVEDIVDKARLLVDQVVIDCGFAIEDDEELSYDTAAPRRNAATLTALEMSDSLVVVGGADPIGLQRLVRAVQDVGVVPSPPPVIVVNKVRASATGSKPERAITSVLSRFAGLEDLHFVPWAPDECDAALLAGRSLTESAGGAAVTMAIRRLAEVLRPELGVSVSRASRRAHRDGGRSIRRGRRTSETSDA